MKTQMPTAHFVNLTLPETEVLIAQALPITKSVLSDTQWWTLIRDFFAMYYCCEPALHKVAEEVLDYLDGEHRGGKPGFPGCLFDLVHYEWAARALAASELPELPATDPQGDLLLGVPVAAPLLRVYAYDYPVHRITPGCLPPARSAATIHLAQYLEDGQRQRWIEIDAESAALLERIETGIRLSGIELQADAALLHTLRRQGLILGALHDPAMTEAADRPVDARILQ